MSLRWAEKTRASTKSKTYLIVIWLWMKSRQALEKKSRFGYLGFYIDPIFMSFEDDKIAFQSQSELFLLWQLILEDRNLTGFYSLG
ncbi:hypothetical protein [Aquiflexum sp.]|uniref:hypothetical protein n=1 Tax=Aquiflexum sp. TaxID=1872584 RepID=UPI003593C724